jgi:hypothetical protein
MQQREPLGDHFGSEEIYACRIASWSADARDQPKLDRVLANTEHDRDGRGRSLGGAGSGRAAWYGDDCYLPVDQLGRQFRHPIVLTLRPTVFDGDVLTFHEAGFVEAFAERGHIGRIVVARSDAEKADHRQRALLRARGERPDRRRNTEPRDEFATPHSRP